MQVQNLRNGTLLGNGNLVRQLLKSSRMASRMARRNVVPSH